MKRNPYKYRGPHTWALAREAYLAGETARSVADRLDIGFSNMRRRMGQEGWTRRAHAEALDAVRMRRTPLAPEPLFEAPEESRSPPRTRAMEPPPWGEADEVDPVDVGRLAVREAAQAMARGDYGRAALVLKTAESLARLVAAHPGLDPDGALHPEARPVKFTPVRDIFAVINERLRAGEPDGDTG